MLDDVSSVTTLVTWLGRLVTAVGLVVCIRYFRVSRRMWLLTLGMGGLLGIHLLHAALTTLLASGNLSFDNLEAAYSLTLIFDLASWALVVIGLAAVLRDVRRRLSWYESALRVEKLKEKETFPLSPASNEIQTTHRSGA